LKDGVILSSILRDLDPEYDAREIRIQAGPSTWLNNKQNLLSIYKSLFKFIHREEPRLDHQAKIADFRAIAENQTPEGMAQVSRMPTRQRMFMEMKLIKFSLQLLAVMLAVATLGPSNMKYIERIQDGLSDATTLTEIQKIIMQKQEDIDNAIATAGADDTMDNLDDGLRLEQELSRVNGEFELTKKLYADKITQHEHLLENYESLKDMSERLERELEVLRKATRDGASDSQIIKSLEDKIREQDELIATQEAQAEDDRQAKTRLTREVAELSRKSDKADQLDDEVKELRHKNEELSKKANTVDRYKQKLENQQYIERELQNLQYEKEQLQEGVRDRAKLEQRCQALEATQEQYRKRIENYELELVETTNQMKLLRDELLAYKSQVMSLENQRLHDERLITELQEQINTGGGTVVASPGATVGTFNLEQELDNARDIPPNLSLEISRLKAENNLLKNSMGSSAENARLRQELEEEQRQRKRLQESNTDLFEKSVVSQNQINTLVNGMAGGQGLVATLDNALTWGKMRVLTEDYIRDEAYSNLRTQLEQSKLESANDKQKIQELEAQLADKRRELLSANADLSAVEKDSIEALDELKSVDKLISSSLKDELDVLRQQQKNQAADNEHQRSQLIEALLAKDKLRKELDEAKELQEKMANDTISSEEIADVVKKSNDKIEKLRARLKQRQEVSGNISSSNSSPSSMIELSGLVPPPLAVVHIHRRAMASHPQQLYPGSAHTGVGKNMPSRSRIGWLGWIKSGFGLQSCL
jgi:protein HOOK3